MKLLAKISFLLLLAGLALVGLTACSAPDEIGSSPDSGTASSASPTAEGGTETTQETVILDVRTPEEFAVGHLRGAINLDYYNPTFADEVIKLDKTTTYQVYCRTGKRASGAKSLMENAGFEHVSNAGGLEDASKSLGIEIVK